LNPPFPPAGLAFPVAPVGVVAEDVLGELVERGQSKGGVNRAERGAAEVEVEVEGMLANSIRDLAGGEIGEGYAAEVGEGRAGLALPPLPFTSEEAERPFLTRGGPLETTVEAKVVGEGIDPVRECC
jgi:hypothetical protein